MDAYTAIIIPANNSISFSLGVDVSPVFGRAASGTSESSIVTIVPGDGTNAIKHYHKVTEQFYKEFSIAPSPRLTELYKVIQTEIHQTETNLSAIQENLTVNASTKGAFFCEYPIFKDFYLIKGRIIERTGDSVYLCLLTMNVKKEGRNKAQQYTASMNVLQQSIHRSLRKSDIYCRYSTNQYLILLSSTTGEDAAAVAARILKFFSNDYPQKNFQTSYALRIVLPLHD